MFDEDILIKENENWAMYVNSMTKMFQRELDSYSLNGFTLQGRFKVLYGVNKKDQSHMYFAYSVKTGYPYATWKGNEEFDFKKMCMLDDLKEDCDIVRMAEKRREDNEN